MAGAACRCIVDYQRMNPPAVIRRHESAALDVGALYAEFIGNSFKHCIEDRLHNIAVLCGIIIKS